jgi:hypothetical protein
VLGEDFVRGELFEICQTKMCSLFGPSWCMNGSIDEVTGELGVICLPFPHNCVFWENAVCVWVSDFHSVGCLSLCKSVS